MTPLIQTGRRAFTLIELLCVIAIMALVAGLIALGVSRAQSKANQMRQDVNTAKKTL